MSGSASLGLEQAILGHTLAYAQMPFPVQVFVALCLAAIPPSETVGGQEISGGGYVRVAASFARLDTPTNMAANFTSVEFAAATADWGTLGYFELWDAQSGGNRLYWGPLIDPFSGAVATQTVLAAEIVRFSAGTLMVQAASSTGTSTSPGAYLPLAGGTLTGPLILAADPTGLLQAATKGYVDAHSGTGGGAGYLPISGGTLTGPLTLSGAPTAAGQAATKAYVDSQLSGAAVTSFNTRAGAVTLTAADLTAVGGALLTSPTFTGTPQAPTAAPGDNTTTLATTAFVKGAVGTGYLPLTGGVVSGATTFSAGITVTGTAIATKAQVGNVNGPTWTAGNGAPGTTTGLPGTRGTFVYATKGSLYSRLDGTPGATLYVAYGDGTWLPVAGV
jgi:hypothetical protein